MTVEHLMLWYPQFRDDGLSKALEAVDPCPSDG